ncbi:hypothetical protein Tco_0075162 [Tanacetum coccineum]
MTDQPLSADASPTTLSLGYIADSDLEEDKEDPEEDPTDHHLRPTLLLYLQMIFSPQDENTEAFETNESTSTSPTSPHYTPRSPSAKAGIAEFAATLPSSSSPPENVESLKDNIRV